MGKPTLRRKIVSTVSVQRPTVVQRAAMIEYCFLARQWQGRSESPANSCNNQQSCRLPSMFDASLAVYLPVETNKIVASIATRSTGSRRAIASAHLHRHTSSTASSDGPAYTGAKRIFNIQYRRRHLRGSQWRVIISIYENRRTSSSGRSTFGDDHLINVDLRDDDMANAIPHENFVCGSFA